LSLKKCILQCFFIIKKVQEVGFT